MVKALVVPSKSFMSCEGVDEDFLSIQQELRSKKPAVFCGSNIIGLLRATRGKKILKIHCKDKKKT